MDSSHKKCLRVKPCIFPPDHLYFMVNDAQSVVNRFFGGSQSALLAHRFLLAWQF